MRPSREEKLIKILERFPDGISFNSLCDVVAKEHLMSRRTLHKYLDKLVETGLVFSESERRVPWKRGMRKRFRLSGAYERVREQEREVDLVRDMHITQLRRLEQNYLHRDISRDEYAGSVHAFIRSLGSAYSVEPVAQIYFTGLLRSEDVAKSLLYQLMEGFSRVLVEFGRQCKEHAIHEPWVEEVDSDRLRWLGQLRHLIGESKETDPALEYTGRFIELLRYLYVKKELGQSPDDIPPLPWRYKEMVRNFHESTADEMALFMLRDDWETRELELDDIKALYQELKDVIERLS